jgi:D-alanyl-D-alanine carboxypeptidase
MSAPTQPSFYERVALAEELQELVERDVRAYPQMPGRLLRVLAPRIDIEVAAGVADVATREPLAIGSRFRIASVTKPFVAAATLRLVEDARLHLEASIDELLPTAFLDVLRAGGYRPEAITLRHLLTHTSGIYDFAADAYDPAIVDGYSAAAMADPRRRWTRLEQTLFAMDHGRPYGEPGKVCEYSDTGAGLVGEIIEQSTGGTMGAAIRDLLGLERLGLAHTYHESVDPDPPGPAPLAHQYEGEFDVAGFDASIDLWGGGGLVSTCSDLARFFRALLRGELFRLPETLGVMCTLSGGVQPSQASSTAKFTIDPGDSAMFLFRAELAGEEFWGHDGFWGTTAYTSPSLDLTVVSQHGQAHMPDGFDRSAIIADVVRLLS